MIKGKQMIENYIQETKWYVYYQIQGEIDSKERNRKILSWEHF